MRKTPLLLALIVPAACGGRTLGDWPLAASGGSGSAFAGASGGLVPLVGTGGVATGGRSSSGGSPSSGGALASGGFATGGFATGGFATGGFATGGFATGGLGSGGRESCLERTQPDEGLCIHVRLCSAAQYETLCLMDTPSSAVCFCYVDGVVTSATSIVSATRDALCEPAAYTHCP